MEVRGVLCSIAAHGSPVTAVSPSFIVVMISMRRGVHFALHFRKTVGLVESPYSATE